MVVFSAPLLILLGFLGLPSLWAPGPAANNSGNKDYAKGRYGPALEQYQKAQQLLPAEKILQLNNGTALLGAGKAQDALSPLMSASADPRREVQSRALYNAGNALAAEQKLEGALDAYRRAILSDPRNQDAKFNYELMKRKLAEQQKQEQKNKDKQDQKKDQDKDQKQDQDQQKQDQEKKEQQKQDEQKQQDEQKPPDPQDPNQPPEAGDPKDAPPQPAGMMTKQEAERLLDALKDNEIKQLKEKLKSNRRKNVEKDW